MRAPSASCRGQNDTVRSRSGTTVTRLITREGRKIVRILIHPRNLTADDKDLRTRTEAALEAGLSPIHPSLRSVEAYVTDVNGPRGGPDTTAKSAARPRWVTGIPAAAGAAMAEVIPGTT
jgi:hypothetical protein